MGGRKCDRHRIVVWVRDVHAEGRGSALASRSISWRIDRGRIWGCCKHPPRGNGGRRCCEKCAYRDEGPRSLRGTQLAGDHFFSLGWLRTEKRDRLDQPWLAISLVGTACGSSCPRPAREAQGPAKTVAELLRHFECQRAGRRVAMNGDRLGTSRTPEHEVERRPSSGIQSRPSRWPLGTARHHAPRTFEHRTISDSCQKH